MLPPPKEVCLAITVVLAVGFGCSHSSSYYFDKGKTLVVQGKLDEGALNIRKAIQRDPTLGAGYLELANIYIKQNKGREAYGALDQAVQLLPGSDEAKIKFADFCLSGYLSDPRRPQVLHAQVEKLSLQLLARNPNSFDGH